MKLRQMKRFSANDVACICVLVLIPSSTGQAKPDSWNQWLGPNRNGHTSEPAGTWPPKKLWEKRVGDSDSSPILVNGAIYVTTLSGRQTSIKCLDARSGRLLWDGTSPGGKYGRYARGDQGQYCGPLSTPACDGKFLFTVSVDGDVQCRDARTGSRKWGFNLYNIYRMGRRKHSRDYGYTTSPMLAGKNIILEVGGNKGAVMRFDKNTGRPIGAWGKGQVGHSSGPVGRGGKVFFGLKHLWIGETRIDWNTDYANNIATPAVSGKFVVCSSAYNIKKTVCFVNGREAWSTRRHDGVRCPVINLKARQVYLPGEGRCLSLANGKDLWKFGRATNVIVTGDNKLIVFGSKIRLYDLSGKKLSEVPAIDAGWPGGALGEGFLVFKNRRSVVCYSVNVSAR